MLARCVAYTSSDEDEMEPLDKTKGPILPLYEVDCFTLANVNTDSVRHGVVAYSGTVAPPV